MLWHDLKEQFVLKNPPKWLNYNKSAKMSVTDSCTAVKDSLPTPVAQIVVRIGLSLPHSAVTDGKSQ